MLRDYQRRLKELSERAIELCTEIEHLYNELEDKEKEKEIQLEDCQKEEQRKVIKDEINYIKCLKEVADNTLYYDGDPYECLIMRWGDVE